MTDLEKAIEAIEKQQGKLKKFSMAHTVGEQLKDILRDQPTAAGIVLLLTVMILNVIQLKFTGMLDKEGD